jgi:hypothetical protein
MHRNAYHSYLYTGSVLSNFNENKGVLTNFNKTHQHQISQKPIWWFSSCYMWIDIHAGMHASINAIADRWTF